MSSITKEEFLEVESSLKEKISHGDMDACKTLGDLYYQGYTGNDNNNQKAFPYWKRAADAGNVSAAGLIGIRLFTGAYGNNREAEAIPYLMAAADAGANGPGPQFMLGMAYDYGRGCRENKVLAEKYYRMAALQKQHDQRAYALKEREASDQGKHSEDDKRRESNTSDHQPPIDSHLGDKKISGDIVFEGVVDANPQYGEGGGTQLFIRDFEAMGLSQDGRFKRLAIDEKGVVVEGSELGKTGEMPEIFLSVASPMDNSVIKTGKSQDGTFSFSLDERGFNGDEISQLDQNTNPDENELKRVSVIKVSPDATTFSKTIEENGKAYVRTYAIEEGDLSAKEQTQWKQLDENTIDNQGLPRVIRAEGQQMKEDFKQPHSDQEDSGGALDPDGWKESRELRPGEIVYQIRPLNPEHPSPYVTDSRTIDSCREKDGIINLEKLLGKLQIASGNNTTYTLRGLRWACTSTRFLTG